MSRPLSPWRRIANAFWLLLNVLLGTALVVSAYAGCESPLERPILGVVVLTFPGWLAAIALVLVADLIWWRRTALVAIAAIAASWPMVWNTCPLNIGGGIPGGTPPDRVFTLMTYNAFNFTDQHGTYPGGVNPTISFILRTDADIVCIQELQVLEQQPERHIGQAQLDSLHARYPYIILSGYAVALMSKFPVTPVHLDVSSQERGNFCDAAAYVVDVEGRRLALFNVHMQSYSLTANDKAAYRDLTRLRPDEDIHELRNTLLYKLEVAAMRRSKQAHTLARYIEYYGGENVVLCGDFNDVPGCYTLRTLADTGMREVWPEVAFGPTWTYNANRFFFRIDHLMWRGAFRPDDVRRPHVPYSDHYPLVTTFVWDADSTAIHQ